MLKRIGGVYYYRKRFRKRFYLSETFPKTPSLHFKGWFFYVPMCFTSFSMCQVFKHKGT